MDGTNKKEGKGLEGAADGEQWPGIDSRYRLIIVAALRSKQLQRGASPRIAADPLKRRNTSIALEEAKRGLVHFRNVDEDEEGGADGQQQQPPPGGSL